MIELCIIICYLNKRKDLIMKIAIILASSLVIFMGLAYAEEQEGDRPKEAAKSRPQTVILQESNGWVYATDKDRFLLQTFLFDPTSTKTGPVAGQAVKIGDSQIPVMIWDKGGALSASAEYANVILDVQKLKAKDFDSVLLGYQYTVTGHKCCSIHLDITGVKRLYVSPEYIVFADDRREVGKKGTFVQVTFDPSPKSQGETSVKGTLIVSRNDKEIGRYVLKGTHTIPVTFQNTKSQNDVVQWKVQAVNKEFTHSGMMGFPLRSSAPNVVKYRVKLAEGRTQQDTRVR